MKIIGTPEGRPGIWLITPDVAAALIDAAPGDDVHNVIGHGSVLIGANWPKEDAKEYVARPDLRLALIFPPNLTGKHQLVAVGNGERHSWDIGEIPEERMVKDQ